MIIIVFVKLISGILLPLIYLFIFIYFSLGQQYAFCRAYLNIPNRQDLIVFTEKFQGYVFVDKNGNFIFSQSFLFSI